MLKNPPGDAGDEGSISGLGRSPRERNDNLFQYFCLDRGAWKATIHGVAIELNMTFPGSSDGKESA